MTLHHVLEVDDLSPHDLVEVLDRAESEPPARLLTGCGVGLVFEKPSARTRNSMELAVVQLGGHPVTIRGDEVGLDVRETVEDVTRTLAGYHTVVGARVFDHAVVERMAAVSPVPIINMLSDLAHPLQALADLLTLRQQWGGELAGRSVAFIGDGDNNVCRSLTYACAMVGVDVRIAAPPGHQPAPEFLDRAAGLGGVVTVSPRPHDAAEGADAVYTDVWVSMGQDAESADRQHAFEGFTIDGSVMGAAADGAVFLHCLPAHRGEEVSAEVIDGPASVVWPQAANRMHAARGLLWWLVERAGTGGAA